MQIQLEVHKDTWQLRTMCMLSTETAQALTSGACLHPIEAYNSLFQLAMLLQSCKKSTPLFHVHDENSTWCTDIFLWTFCIAQAIVWTPFKNRRAKAFPIMFFSSRKSEELWQVHATSKMFNTSIIIVT